MASTLNPPTPSASSALSNADEGYTEVIPSTSSQAPLDRNRTRSVLWRLYLSHTLSTWNSRTFEFGAVIFLGAIFPGTLFHASCYALFRSAAAAVLSSWIGELVDRSDRLRTVRHSIVWQRCSVAISCLLLLALLGRKEEDKLATISLFAVTVGLACLEKLASIANTVSVERDWVIVVADSLEMERQELNSTMRRIDLVCKLVAPLSISLVDGYSTNTAIWVVFVQNAMGVVFEYFAIAQVFAAVPELAHGKREHSKTQEPTPLGHGRLASALSCIAPFRTYTSNPVFIASFSLSLLYLTVLSFGSQMTTYLLTIGFTPVHISLMRLVAVILELSATCATPVLMRKIGAIRSGLWFINEQLLSVMLAVIFFFHNNPNTKFAGSVLVSGVIISRVGLWGFDLCVQFLVQEDAPASSRGSFSAVEAALQNFFELISFAMTMVFSQPEEFQIPVYVSATAVAVSAAAFAKFVRGKRGHLLHTSKCFRRERRGKYNVLLPTIKEEEELDELGVPHD